MYWRYNAKVSKELQTYGISSQNQEWSQKIKPAVTFFFGSSRVIKNLKSSHHVIKHTDLNAIFQWSEILYLYYSRLNPLRPYVQYALHCIQLLSTECGNVLYFVWHSGKACAGSAKLWMSHQISIWFLRDTIFSAVDCIFMHRGKWRKSALKPSKYSKVPSKVL